MLKITPRRRDLDTKRETKETPVAISNISTLDGLLKRARRLVIDLQTKKKLSFFVYLLRST